MMRKDYVRQFSRYFAQSTRGIRLYALLSILLQISYPGLQIQAQQDSTGNSHFFLEVNAGYINDQGVPLWMRANQYGSIPLEGASSSVIGRVFKNYASPKQGQRPRSFDWGYALEGRANLGKKVHGDLIEAHVKLKYHAAEFRLGRSKEVMGLNGDSLLSSGNFAVSGNALGVPKAEISIPDYYRLPWFGGIFAFKGNFALGYMGKSEMNPSAFLVPTKDYELETYLLQKSFYLNFGKPSWKLNLIGGFNHQAQFGGEKKRYGEDFDLNLFQTLNYVSFGKAFGGKGSPVPRSKIGNHQGSIDLGFSYDFGNIKLLVYRQNFYDVGALSKLANIKDGLNGITLSNKAFHTKAGKAFDWQSLLIEFFYSKNQAGYPWSKPTQSGDEDYYNNSEYLEGWSYKGLGMGSPLIATAQSVRPGQAHYPKDFFISNRVVAGHLGSKFSLYQWYIISKLTFARHYGTFATSEFGKSTGSHFHTPYKDSFTPVNQFSFLIRAEREFLHKTRIGATFATDQGKLYYSGSGLMLHVNRYF